MIVDPTIGDRVRCIRGANDGDMGTIDDVTGFGGSDSRTWRWSLKVHFDNGTGNLLTEHDLERVSASG